MTDVKGLVMNTFIKKELFTKFLRILKYGSQNIYYKNRRNVI